MAGKHLELYNTICKLLETTQHILLSGLHPAKGRKLRVTIYGICGSMEWQPRISFTFKSKKKMLTTLWHEGDQSNLKVWCQPLATRVQIHLMTMFQAQFFQGTQSCQFLFSGSKFYAMSSSIREMNHMSQEHIKIPLAVGNCQVFSVGRTGHYHGKMWAL